MQFNDQYANRYIKPDPDNFGELKSEVPLNAPNIDSLDVRVTDIEIEDACILHYNTPSTGQVLGIGSNNLNYDADVTGTNSRVTRSGSNIYVGVAGFYMITLNLRCIDAPRPTLQLIDAHNGDGIWTPLIYWSPHTHLTASSTSRQHTPISVVAYLPAGSYMRHRVDVTTGSTRFGANNNEFGKFNTSMGCVRVG